MISKKEIETILKVNGIPEGSPDDQVRSVLLSARFNKDEVDTALLVLRQNSKTNDKRVDGLHKIFRTNEGLKPEEVFKLLGVETNHIDAVLERRKKHQISPVELTVIWLLSLTLAILGLLLYMYVSHVGIFHSSSELILHK